jgi:hypothetical protein
LDRKIVTSVFIVQQMSRERENMLAKHNGDLV